MTIRFLKSWNGYYEGQIVSNVAGRTEADLIDLKYAVADLDGPDNSPLPVTATTNPLTGGIGLSAPSGPVVTRHLTIYQSATPVLTPLDTVNNVILSCVIPGGLMGPTGRLQVRMMWSYLNNANVKTIKCRLGGIAFAYTAGLASQSGANIFIDILNRGMTNVQILTPININSTTAAFAQPWGVGNVDTSIDQLLTLEIQKAVGTDTAVLEAAFVEIF